MQFRFFASVLAVFACCSPALAQQSDAADAFQRADANHDSITTRAEFNAANAAAFARLDANGDGVMEASERPTPPAETPETVRRFLATAEITRAQYDEMQANGFAQLDHNNDGQVTNAELSSPAQ